MSENPHFLKHYPCSTVPRLFALPYQARAPKHGGWDCLGSGRRRGTPGSLRDLNQLVGPLSTQRIESRQAMNNESR